jgi:coenzyme F420-reducing hydrogenase gamma subunit
VNTKGNGAKPRVAFFDFASCEGCQLTVVDALQTHVDLLGAVDIVQFREAMSEHSDDYQIAFIEGSCTRARDEERLKGIRERAQLVVALGACAHIGGVNAGRLGQSVEAVSGYVYGADAASIDSGPVRPIGDVIQVDAVVPGCPINGEEFVRSVKMLLQGRLPTLPDYPVCAECKLRENPCVYSLGGTCLGPVTRAGCGALCPTYRTGCEGCRGLAPGANLPSLREVLAEHGLDERAADDSLRLFLSAELTGRES